MRMSVFRGKVSRVYVVEYLYSPDVSFDELSVRPGRNRWCSTQHKHVGISKKSVMSSDVFQHARRNKMRRDASSIK